MRFTHLTGFEKHLRDSYPDHLSSIYLIALGNKEERMRMLEGLNNMIGKGIENFSHFFASGEKSSFEEVVEKLQFGSLFSSYDLALVDEVEKMGGEVKALLQVEGKKSLLLGLEGGKGSQKIYGELKRKAIFLDLSDEKPWEREKRVRSYIARRVMREKKQLTAPAEEVLFQTVGVDLLSLEKEIEKLLCYVGDKERIEKEDVLALSSDKSPEKSWQVVESLFVKGKCDHIVEDVTELLGLIFLIRNLVHIAICLEEGLEFPGARPYQIDRAKKIVHGKKGAFLIKVLADLAKMELQAKSESTSAALLWEQFVGGIL